MLSTSITCGLVVTPPSPWPMVFLQTSRELFRSGFSAQDLLGRPSAMVQIPRGFVPPALCPAPTTASCAVTPQALPAAEQMGSESLDMPLAEQLSLGIPSHDQFS